jgi:glucosylceramidase
VESLNAQRALRHCTQTRKIALLGLLVLAGSAAGTGTHAGMREMADSGTSVAVTLTTDDRRHRLAKAPAAVFRPMRPGARTLYIDDRRTYQTVEGFGAAWTDSTGYLLNEVAAPRARRQAMRELFTRERGGIGLSFMRIPMGASDIARSRYSYDDRPPGRTDPTLADFSIAHDRRDLIPLIRESLALNPRMTLMATPWSPPGWMKTSGSMVGGTLLSRETAAFAQYFVKFLRAYDEAGIPVRYITLQNEPLYQPSDYPGMSMPPATELAVLRDDVLPALRAAGLATRVLLYDHNWDRPDYPDTILRDPRIRASGQVAGVAWHGYGGVPGAQTLLRLKYPRFGEFQTEHSGGTWVQDQVRSDFEEIIQVLRDYGRAYVKWSLALDQSLGPHDGGCGTCTPIVTVNTATGAVSEDIEFSTLGQFSRFILPGARRVYSSDASGIESVALVNPDGGHVLVAFNDTKRPRTFQIQWGARGFRYSLPPYSGATFSWHGRAIGQPAGGFAPRANAYHAAASYAATGGRHSASDLSTWGVRTEQSSSPDGGYDLSHAAAGDWVEYPGLSFPVPVRSVGAQVACGRSSCGLLEFHLDSPSGPLIARLAVEGTGGWQSWRAVSASAEAPHGTHDLYVLWKPGSSEAAALANLLSFQFH